MFKINELLYINSMIPLFTYLWILVGFNNHDIHLSKSTIHYNAEARSVQISTHLFLDDLEDALYLLGYRDELKLCTPYEAKNGDQAVEQYIKKHLKITLDGRLMEMEYLGKEISEDYMAAWCYLEIANIDQVDKIKVEVSYLHEIFDDQKNIITIKLNRKSITDWLMDDVSISKEIRLSQYWDK